MENCQNDQQLIIKELINEIKNLQQQVSVMNQTMTILQQKVEDSNRILINHIGFVDNVFNSIKRPLFFIMNKVNGLLHLEDQNNQEL